MADSKKPSSQAYPRRPWKTNNMRSVSSDMSATRKKKINTAYSQA
jgi:hypothetical protein